MNNKLSKLKQGKITELQKKIRDQATEIGILKEMVKSSKNEVHSKEISISKYKKRMTSLEKIVKLRAKMSEINSTGSQNSQRNRSLGRQNDTQEYDTYEDMPERDNDQVIVEAEENLEATGNHDAYYQQQQQNMNLNKYSKTPNIRLSKHLNNSKISNIEKSSPERLKPNDSMPKMSSTKDPFMNKVKKGYDHYKDSLNKPDFKNNSYGVKGIFNSGTSNFESHQKGQYFHSDHQFELPAIKESQGAVIFDRKKLDSMKKDSDETKSTVNISNTYKQSYRIY